jgi:hypothetical protein
MRNYAQPADSYSDLLGAWYGLEIGLLLLMLLSAMFAAFIGGGVCFLDADRFDLTYWRIYGPFFNLVVMIWMIALMAAPQSNELYWIALLFDLAGTIMMTANTLYYIRDYNDCTTSPWCSCYTILTTNPQNVDWVWIAFTVVYSVWALLDLEFLIFVNIMWRTEVFRQWLRYLGSSGGDAYSRWIYSNNAGRAFSNTTGGQQQPYDPGSFTAPTALQQQQQELDQEPLGQIQSQLISAPVHSAQRPGQPITLSDEDARRLASALYTSV